MKKNKVGKGVIFWQHLKSEGGNYVGIWGKNIPGGETSSVKGWYECIFGIFEEQQEH